MNRVDLHPEQLFDYLRDGSIKPDELALLQAHCGSCSPCRLELQLVFEPIGAPLPDREDRALGMAVVDRMLCSPARATGDADMNDSGPGSAPDRRVRARVSAFQRGRSAAFIAAGIVLGCSVTAAALVPKFSTAIVSAVSSMVGLSPVGLSQRVRRAMVQPEPGRPPSAPATLRDPEPRSDLVPVAPSADVSREAPAPLAGSSRSGSARRAASARFRKAPIDGPDALLAAARRARARGADAEAADYYRMLQRHYPNTEAEIVARVSLGRLLCLRLAQPEGALELFDDYLSQRPNGALGQEARSGRAQCLERLGRVDEARAAWEELALRHPNSVYADEARVRLARP